MMELYTSSIVSTATVTRVGGLGGGELESATACCVVAVPGPTTAVPGRVLKSPTRVRLRQSPGHLSKSPSRLLGFPSRIRLHQGQVVRRWNLILETA